jgi:hypothetical protein
MKKIRRIVIEASSDSKLKIRIVEETYDLKEYTRALVDWVKKDPLNRHGTMVEHHCSDNDLTDEMLFEHFMQSGGAVWAAEHIKPLHVKITDINPDNHDCAILKGITEVINSCQNCPICNLKPKE